MRSKPFIRVCSANLNRPAGDVFTRPDHVGQSVPIPGVHRMRMMRVREGLELIRSSHGRRWLWGTARQRIYSRRVAIGVRRDLSVPFPVPPAKIPLVVRQIRPDDDLSFITAVPGLTPREAQQRADQRWRLSGDLPTCWVAVDPDGTVCFMAWLLTARDNAVIRARWGELLPQLQPDEALIEGPYAAESHRGLGIMTDAGNRIVERARDFGARYGMGFIAEGNVASLKASEKAGWVPFVKREESWFLFRRRIRFLPLANATK
jgi:GNAT superfamily N-acetyltransferase